VKLPCVQSVRSVLVVAGVFTAVACQAGTIDLTDPSWAGPDAGARTRAAQAPGGCDDAKSRRAYDQGWRNANHKILQMWRQQRRDCDRLEPWMERVLAEIEKIVRHQHRADAHAHRRCRIAGGVDGAFAGIEEVERHCLGACLLSGELVGAVAAVTYCELAIAHCGDVDAPEWIRRPVNVCGLAYEVGCDSAFIGDTIAYQSEAGACIDYTAGEFAQVWERSRLRACDYHERDESD
jgi:hypothetical protein